MGHHRLFVSDAGIKYWDNPEYKAFDVGDYVSGAVWNYDGIRNVGANADHDSTALTWVNLGSFGSVNNVFLQKATSSWPSVSAAELAAGTYGEWAEDGFVFKGTSRMRCNSPGGINVPGYAASKGGVAQLAKALANEWAGKGVNVNAIAPGYIATDNTAALRADPERSRQILERIPAGRWGTPADIAGACVFLCSPAAAYVHGAIIPVDGGWLAR